MKRRFMVLLGLFCFAATAWAAGNSSGRVAAVQGAATLERGGKAYRLTQGTALYAGDSVVTTKDAFAKLLMADDSLLTVGASSRFKVEQFKVETGMRTASFRLFFGKMRAIVSKFAAGPTDYRFSTPTAVAGVRGTHLLLEFNSGAKETKLSVLEGTVGFRASDTKGGVEVFVNANQQSVKQGDQPPQPPRNLTPEELKKLNQEIASQTPGSSGASQTASGEKGQPGQGEKGQPVQGKAGGNETASEPGGGEREPGSPLTNPQENDRQLPVRNPAADTGVRVRW